MDFGWWTKKPYLKTHKSSLIVEVWLFMGGFNYWVPTAQTLKLDISFTHFTEHIQCITQTSNVESKSDVEDLYIKWQLLPRKVWLISPTPTIWASTIVTKVANFHRQEPKCREHKRRRQLLKNAYLSFSSLLTSQLDMYLNKLTTIKRDIKNFKLKCLCSRIYKYILLL